MQTNPEGKFEFANPIEARVWIAQLLIDYTKKLVETRDAEKISLAMSVFLEGVAPNSLKMAADEMVEFANLIGESAVTLGAEVSAPKSIGFSLPDPGVN